MFTKKWFTARIALLLMMVFGFNTLAAAEQIKADRLGPIASLAKAGKSMYFLTALLDEKGRKLDPADNGKWGDENFTLPDGATEDKAGMLAFLTATNATPSNGKMKAKKARGERKGAQTACPTPAPTEKNITVTKEHELFELSVAKTIKVGETATFPKFTDGSMFYLVDADQNQNGMTEFGQNRDTFTITGKKVGRNIITVWVSTDKKIREVINVNVIAATPAAAGKKAANVLTDWPVEVAIVILVLAVILLLVLIFASRRRRQDENSTGFSNSVGTPLSTDSTTRTQHAVPEEKPSASGRDDLYEQV